MSISPGTNDADNPAINARDRNLLDNVSLMTTLSPMPSNNTSLQPHGTSTQELLNGVFGDAKAELSTMETNQVSTFDDMQKKLLAQLDRDSTGGTEAGTGTGKLMYGFDLSPIHSVDKPSTYASTQEEPPTTEKLKRRGDFDISPNFMRASRQSKSEKSGNNDTETMMSQVFSSQDVGSSTNNFNYSKHERTDDAKRTYTRPGSVEKKKTQKGTSKLAQKPAKSPSSQKTYRDTPNKTFTKGKKSPAPKKSNLTSEFVIPKSPPSRRAVVKVTPRIKTTPRKQSKKSASAKPSVDATDRLSTGQDSSIERKSVIRSKDDSTVPAVRAGNHDETVSLIHILEDLNQMRNQVAESSEKLAVLSQDKDRLAEEKKRLEIEMTEMKKENFVLKSRLDKTTAYTHPKSGDTKSNEDAEKVGYSDREEMERLLVGYQKENEKIYDNLKKLQQSNKETEQAMYEENLKLRSEIAQLKEELESQSRMNKAHQGVSAESNVHAVNVDASKEEISTLKKRIESLEIQLKEEEGYKAKSESLVRKLTTERDNAEKKIVDNNCKYEEAYGKLASKHKADVVKLEAELEDVKRSLNGKSDAAITIRDIMSTPPSKSLLNHFQKRVKKLEEELGSQDTRANAAVLSVQKQYADIKLKYEERINDLEKQIQLFRKNTKSDSLDANTVDSLKKQLSEALSKLQAESDQRRMERDALFEQINSLRQRKDAIARNTSEENSKMSALIQECERKDKEITRLKATVEKLKVNTPKKSPPARPKNEKRRRNSYNPESFEGEGYAKLMELNLRLENQLRDKELELKHAEVTKDAAIAKLQQEVRSQKSTSESAKARQESEMESQAQAKIARLESELRKRCDEISVLRGDLSEMSDAKVRERALQSQIQRLLAQVREARVVSPSSAARRVAALEDKLRVLEEKLKIRDFELRESRFRNADPGALSELQSLRRELALKNSEMTKFRLELDSILLVLRELHLQGVKIPLPNYLHSIF